MPNREEQSRVPVLVSPREETVVDGRRITFVWNPVDGATQYKLQISGSPSFDAVIYEATVEDRTDHVVENEFDANEDTYYWRIVTTDREGHSHGEDNIESFISGTSEERDLHLASPDDDEEYGPAERLFRGAKAEAAAEVTGAPRYIDEESDLGVQHEGIEAGQIVGFALATAVALGLAIFTLFQYVHIVSDTTRFTAAGVSGYPELRETELEATRQLTQYGVVDADEDVYRIPIDRAIDLMANEARQTEREFSDELNLQAEAQ